VAEDAPSLLASIIERLGAQPPEGRAQPPARVSRGPLRGANHGTEGGEHDRSIPPLDGSPG
jgi:hypothetical protein